MSAPSQGEVTAILSRIESGDESAKNRLLEVAYDELRRVAGGLMRGERAAHTLQPTALVHEAAMRIFSDASLADIPSRAFFFWAMARAMRQVLVDHARTRGRIRRGGDRQRVPLDDVLDFVQSEQKIDLLELDEALSRLELVNEREYKVVIMRFFGGMRMHEIAEALGVSRATVESDWKFARVWLRRHLREDQ